MIVSHLSRPQLPNKMKAMDVYIDSNKYLFGGDDSSSPHICNFSLHHWWNHWWRATVSLSVHIQRRVELSVLLIVATPLVGGAYVCPYFSLSFGGHTQFSRTECYSAAVRTHCAHSRASARTQLCSLTHTGTNVHTCIRVQWYARTCTHSHQ